MSEDNSVPPGCEKIEFSFGPHGLDVKGDEIIAVTPGTQAESKGVKPGWKIVMIDGNTMDDNNMIRPTLQKKAKAGKKYAIVFSKSASEMRNEMQAAEQKEAQKREALMKKQEQERKEKEEKAAAEAKKKKEIDARKAAYADGQKKAMCTEAPPGITLPTPKPKTGSTPAAAPPGDNEVVVKYVQYAEKFPLKDGSTLTSKEIDEVYCLTSVMPGCCLHLGVREFKHTDEHMYVKEDPVGTFSGLTPKMTYYLYVQQDKGQEEEDMKRMRQVWANAGKDASATGSRGEGCSCLYGTPCQDKYVCLDWDNRIAVAKAHGMLPIG